MSKVVVLQILNFSGVKDGLGFQLLGYSPNGKRHASLGAQTMRMITSWRRSRNGVDHSALIDPSALRMESGSCRRSNTLQTMGISLFGNS